ncbi:PREDICTED: uncharacterized protein LOC108780977 [Cyphomyrmex costatus]|uniref:uncharacterized protein LOC108780977 n=1 Tax=Cyphomyrmex costatus TaxID=456900 RepID=UPI000852408F|nr:PREDICTED: uncharacterized protein LOC108780977 [Cyphomyrmex costatus]
MLECGGDQAWLLGLTGSGKKKCKWRPFGSRSRRRRQRGMKRNIQNSQTQPRIVNAERSKEKQVPTGPRVRPSDRESIQKMLANLPAKRATRKVLQDNMMRSQGRLRNVQTRTRPCIIGDNSSRISRNKAALRNKLLKNAKSIQRNRCRSDNIAAVIESVVRKCHETEKKLDSDVDKTAETENKDKKDAKEMNEGSLKATSKASDQNDRTIRPRVVGRPKVLGKKRNVKNPRLQSKSSNKLVKTLGKFSKFKNDITSETKGEGEEASSPKSTPKNAKMTPKAINKNDVNINIKKISTISAVKNKNKLTQNILKKKRPVDPVASMNASIKAKSQLRTQDGKFARNPNKNLSAKLFEAKTDDEKYKSADWLEIKPKLKAAQKLKKIGVQLPRRITRLSSDSDKMPTLEPVVQIVSSNEEYVDKSANDLPILSPVTSSSSLQDQKTSRISTKCVLKEKEENIETNADLEAIPEKRKKEQKSTRGRKPKEETKDMAKRRKTNTIEENKASKNNVIVLKDERMKGRKSLPILNANSGENSKEEILKKETIAKKDFKSKKEEATKETRSNSKTRVKKDLVKLSDIPFEVKKLLYSAQCILDKDDLLSTLELASNDSKRNLRQLAPRSKVLQVSDKKSRELDDESNGSKDTSKKEKIEANKKSSRKNAEKKGDDKLAKTSLEKDSTSNAIANIAQNERNQQGKKDRTVKTKEIMVDNPEMKSKTDGRQTRGSMSDVKNEPSLEIVSDNLRKDKSLLGKRRSRNKSLDKDEVTNFRASKAQSGSENASSSGKEAEKELGEVIDKISKKEIETESDKNSDDRLDSTVVNINLSHLQSETSNLSIDSGKENSLETSVNVHSKLKVGRPKKSWGARREKSLRRRSLNNVIGILTEGMNIPVEAQQNVQVLTVQTSLDNPDRLARNGSVQQPSSGEGNMIDSAFSELSVLTKSEEKSTENEIVTATSTTDSSHADDKKNACPDEAQLENAFADGKVDVSLKVATAKACSPANDIILDLSRRKPKGKGSFLEKIVSKIAKQKDALLEGEVGSLLDTAADELTSILDEVGPTLTDNTESTNSNEANHASKNDKNVTVTFTDKELPMIVDSEVQALENEKISVESAVSKRSTDSLEMSDNLEKSLAAKTETQSENQIRADNISDVEMKNNDDLDRKVSSVEENVESCEKKSMTNEEPIIPIKIPNESSSSLTDTSISCSLIMTQKENLEKPERKKGVTKSRRKSNKKSLDARSKKNKKRLLEIIEDCTEEDAQKKLGLNDTFKSDIGNEFSKKDDSMETLNTNIEAEKLNLLQHNESEIIKDNLKPTNLENNLMKANHESDLEIFTDLSEITCENAKLMADLEKSLDKIISDEDITNDQSIESTEKNIDFSILSSEKSVECRKSTNRNKKKNQVNSNGSSSRRKSKRKSKSVLSITSPMDVTTNILETSIELMDETEKIPSSLSTLRESLELTDMQSIKTGTTSDSDTPLENILHAVEIAPEKRKETQNTDSENLSLVNSMSSKTTKKRGAKKKSLAEEHLELPEDKSTKIVSKFNDESSIADTNEQLSVSLEHFKIPEVKDLPQSAKKRSPKKKLQSEEDRWNSGNVSEESQTNEEPMVIGEISNSIEEKVKEQEEIEKHVTGEESNTKKFERSSSSGSIGLAPFLPKTRSMFKRKTQLSSEDLADCGIRNQSAESMDDLSESSCVSESSYFRKKRFAKKKRKEEMVVGSARADSSLIDSIALKSGKQSPKEKTSKSLLDEHLDLSDVDDIDIPMDIQASLENTEALEKIERELELTNKSLDPQNEDSNKLIDDTENKDSDALERPASNNHDSSDNPVTPKKRTAGNFVVVHTKTGEILIVEKKKKLTKETPKFFCGVCATSFTRKSSLKKHTLSQSHLSQLTKSTKDKIESVNSNTFENTEEDDNEWKSNQENDQQTKNVLEDAPSHETDRKSLELDENFVPYTSSTEVELTKSLVDLGTRQMLEDKLLDEEICKITENMSHDEYVLTDQLTPEEPMLSSTPIKAIQTKQEDSGRSKNNDKKRNKSKKRNLAEEHLLLDSPKLENSKIDSSELSKPTNDVQVSSPSCDYSSMKEIMEIVEKTGDISKECVDNTETENQSELIVKSLNEETDLKSVCDTDRKADQQTESTRTTKKTSRKVSKAYNEEKEETSALTEINRFSLRPRRSKNIQHYEESDIEADIFFMDTSTEMNSDEKEDSCDVQKRQNEVKETNRDALQENAYVATDDKSPQNTEVANLTTDSTNSTKKKKRGRPRLKDRIVPNSSNTSASAKLEVNGNDSVATSNLDESKIEDQKLNLHTKERLDKISKPPHIDANAQPPPKRSRGRPRKNPVPITNSSVQADNSSASELTKSNYDEVKEKADVIESCSKMVIEESTSISSLIPNAESSPAVQDHTSESSLSKTKKDLLNAEDVQSTELNVSKDRSTQRIESTDIAIDDTVLAKNCENMLTSNVPSEKVEILIPSETNTCVDDAKCVLEDKRNDTNVNVLVHLTTESSAELPSQIIEQVSIDDLESAESKAIELDNNESFEIPKSTNILEEEQMKPREQLFEEEVPKAKILLGSESEDKTLTADNKPVLNFHESQKILNDSGNDSTYDEKTIRRESNKKLSRKSTSKERETDRKRLKTSKDKKKKIKVAELSSDSENEDDRIESAASSKSKIVKSVFGRVFGGEKADKVKEVLNDWVSRSEDDSDISKNALDARSYLRGLTKFPENGHKKEKKCHFGSETKKDTERLHRKKGNDKCGSEVQGKAKNRKKREKNTESISEDRIGSPINPAKRRYRESKIRADEKILRAFDDELLTILDEDNKTKEMSNQINEFNDKDKETKRHHEKDLNKERTKNKNLTSENWESLRVEHDSCGKSKNSSSHRKKQDAKEPASSPSQSESKYRCRESKTKAGERIWRAFDNEISSCLSDDQDLNEFHEISKEQRFEFDESKDLNRLENNSKNVKQTDDDTWKDVSSIDQEQSVVHSGRGRSRKNSNSRKKQNFNIIKISKSKTNKRISKDHESSIPLEDRETKNEMQNDQTILSTNESRTRSKTLIKDSSYESIYGDLVVSKHVKKDGDNLLTYLDQSTNSKKNKKGIVNEDWKHSARKFDLDDDQLTEKNIGQKGEESTISSRSCSSLAAEEPIMKNQLVDLDGNSQMNRNDNDDNNDNDDEEEDNDSDLERQRLSPFARETPNNFIESSSNNEEEEEEEEEDGEEEEERVTYEDNSRKTNPSEFSGEKIIIRSPSLGHRSDVVTIAPTDAMEDNALDVPREIEEPTTEPRQGKILNFDEELFVECCSRLKATSENELRGAKKIKLDHSESYHRRDDQPQDFRVNRDRWRDVESQNSLGSLLESVNQLLGEEMYNSHDKSYRMHGSERSSRSASPDASRIDNLGYEDSLDVAFEHNNKLRDKIQQRMRESENLIASTFGQKINDRSDDKRDSVGNSYSSSIHEHEQLPTSIASNRELGSSPGHKNKMNSTLGGLHKALSNLLHSNGKHDHNGSAPMKLLAELACARAPTSTLPEDTTNSNKNHQSVKMVAAAVAAAAAVVVDKDTPTAPKKPMKDSAITSKNSPTKKTRNPIKELFERKKEINDRRQQQRSKGAFVELNVQKQRKSKKSRKQQQEFPLIRRSEHYGGLVEKKKRRDSLDRKGESERIKDVYEFDEEESQMAPTLGSVMSYRSQIDKNYDINWSKIRNTNGNLDTVLQNGKTNYVANTKLDAVINRKFQELEKFAPKTKGALKSFQSEEQQQQQQQITEAVTGPMDEFVERKQRMKRSIERSNEGIKQSGKIKKRGKSSKKRVRNAWYENDSSDEFRTAAKTEDVGVGISKSQRSCSKGKQNLFAELSTSSESEYERDNIDYMTTSEQRSKSKKSSKKPLDDVDETDAQRSEPEFDNEDQVASDWNRAVQEDAMKNDHDVAKSESEMSDHSLVIDERKMIDEGRNSEDDADNQYERTFDLDDLYREDSSDEETEVEENEEPTIEEVKNNRSENQTLDENATLQTKLTSTITKNDCASEMISLEEALDFLDRHENLDPKAEDIRAKNNIINGTMDEVSNDGIINEEMENKCSSPTEMRDEKEEPDDDVPTLPEKLSSNEKPLKESDHNLPLHVFLSRKVQESKKRKQQQLDKLREEQERILMDFQPTRRQRKCAIGKQGLLAEISSSDEESYVRDKDSKKGSDHDKSRKKRELKEKRKERYLEKKHEQMIAKEQKAIEEEILREVGKRKEIIVQNDDIALNTDVVEAIVSGQIQRKKHQTKEKHKKSGDESIEENAMYIDQSFLDNSEDNHDKSDRAFSTAESNTENNDHLSTSLKRKKLAKSSVKSKKVSKSENGKIPTSKRSKEPTAEKSKKSTSNKDSKERRSSSGKRDSDDEELKTTKSWNKVEEGVGVAIGRHKRTAALQLYYWSSSSDEEEAPEPIPAPEEEEDDRQEQHGWIVGDSHKKMITMLAMEKQLKEKRRRSEDEFEPGKAKSKKHRNSTS